LDPYIRHPWDDKKYDKEYFQHAIEKWKDVKILFETKNAKVTEKF